MFFPALHRNLTCDGLTTGCLDEIMLGSGLGPCLTTLTAAYSCSRAPPHKAYGRRSTRKTSEEATEVVEPSAC
jgi:RecA/RadA recombinase